MNLDGAAAIYLRSDFRPNEKTAGTPYSECTYTRGSIPRELHRGMRGRIRPGELERESGGGSFKATVNLSPDGFVRASFFINSAAATTGFREHSDGRARWMLFMEIS